MVGETHDKPIELKSKWAAYKKPSLFKRLFFETKPEPKYFAVYVDIGNLDENSVKAYMDKVADQLTNDHTISDEIRYFIMPVRGTGTKIVLLNK